MNRMKVPITRNVPENLGHVVATGDHGCIPQPCAEKTINAQGKVKGKQTEKRKWRNHEDKICGHHHLTRVHTWLWTEPINYILTPCFRREISKPHAHLHTYNRCVWVHLPKLQSAKLYTKLNQAPLFRASSQSQCVKA